jgi:GNAT superfamily N-acetyltransferase
MARRTGVTLTKPRSRDIEAVSSWLPAVATAAGYGDWDEAALCTALATGQALTDADSLVTFRIGSPVTDAAQIEFLAVRPERRRLGIGGRLVLSVERKLKASIEEIYVSVPSRIGLALYFWLRLGYRPLLQSEWPSKPDGVSIWMKRRLR